MASPTVLPMPFGSHVTNDSSLSGSSTASPGRSSLVEDVELKALEGKLQLLSIQRQLSAVKCQSFLESLETYVASGGAAGRGAGGLPFEVEEGEEEGQESEDPDLVWANFKRTSSCSRRQLEGVGTSSGGIESRRNLSRRLTPPNVSSLGLFRSSSRLALEGKEGPTQCEASRSIESDMAERRRDLGRRLAPRSGTAQQGRLPDASAAPSTASLPSLEASSRRNGGAQQRASWLAMQWNELGAPAEEQKTPGLSPEGPRGLRSAVSWKDISRFGANARRRRQHQHPLADNLQYDLSSTVTPVTEIGKGASPVQNDDDDFGLHYPSSPKRQPFGPSAVPTPSQDSSPVWPSPRYSRRRSASHKDRRHNSTGSKEQRVSSRRSLDTPHVHSMRYDLSYFNHD